MPRFSVPITGPQPDRIPGVLAVNCIAWEGRFGERWAAVVRADSADDARRRVADVVTREGYSAGVGRPVPG